jgi:hypothetical protein
VMLLDDEVVPLVVGECLVHFPREEAEARLQTRQCGGVMCTRPTARAEPPAGRSRLASSPPLTPARPPAPLPRSPGRGARRSQGAGCRGGRAARPAGGPQGRALRALWLRHQPGGVEGERGRVQAHRRELLEP